MKREYPECPLVGVGGIVFKEGRVLLIKRKHPPGVGKWSIPGGLVELGERLKEAVKRELKEETDIDVVPEEVLEVVERIFPDKEGKIRYHYVIVDFICSYLKGEAKAQSDALEICWQPVKGLEGLGLNEELKNLIKKAYKQWQRKRQ